MQKGEFISDRVLPKIIQSISAKYGIACQFFSDDWFVRLERNDKVAWICGYKFDLNRSGAGAVAQDKVATYLALHAAAIPAVPHILARTYGMHLSTAEELTRAFDSTGPVVIKPLDGSGGHNVELCASGQQALQQVMASKQPAWAVSPWLDLASETRFIVLDNRVLLAYEKQQPVVQNGLKMFNLAYGAVPHVMQPTQAMQETAVRACQTLALRVAAVDIVRTHDGKELVLEINDGITMEHFANYSAEYRQKAEQVYEAIVTEMMK